MLVCVRKNTDNYLQFLVYLSNIHVIIDMNVKNVVKVGMKE